MYNMVSSIPSPAIRIIRHTADSLTHSYEKNEIQASFNKPIPGISAMN